MTTLIRVRPSPGLKVRHPQTKQLYGEADVFEIDPKDFFWAKLLEHGDIQRVDAPDLPSSKTTDAL